MLGVLLTAKFHISQFKQCPENMKFEQYHGNMISVYFSSVLRYDFSQIEQYLETMFSISLSSVMRT